MLSLSIYLHGLAINQTQKHLWLQLHYCYSETEDICCREISQIFLIFYLKLYRSKVLMQEANPHFYYYISEVTDLTFLLQKTVQQSKIKLAKGIV